MEDPTLRRIIDFALRVYSYVFAAGTGLVLFGLGVVAKSSGDVVAFQNMPWKGAELTTWLLALGLTGLLAAAGAALTKGLLRFLLPVWTLVWAVLMVRGNFMLPAKSYATVDEFQVTVAYAVGAVGAFLGALTILKKK